MQTISCPYTVQADPFLHAYWHTLNARNYTMDEAQLACAKALQDWAITQLVKIPNYKAGFLQKSFVSLKKILDKKSKGKLGVYVWGGVGRGKSFLMDAFYQWLQGVPTEQFKYIRLQRVHFHAFMRMVHTKLAEWQKQENGMQLLANFIHAQSNCICFDEFHVSDIADAMLLDRLFDALFNLGVHFIVTSNYPIHELYPNGLNRERFLPAIALLNKQLQMLELNHAKDYRLNKQNQSLHLDAKHADTNQQLLELFNTYAEEKILETNITESISETKAKKAKTVYIEHRAIEAHQIDNKIIWFTFEQICNTARSQNDYLELSERYKVFIISDIPNLPPKYVMQARRFTLLVDVLYDQKNILILSTQVGIEQLYVEGTFANEFKRTVSRLQDMQSVDYLSIAQSI